MRKLTIISALPSLTKERLPRRLSNSAQALQLQPTYRQAAINLNKALLDEGNTEQAIHGLQQLLASSPVNPEAHYVLGLAYLKTKEKLLAIDEFEKAIALQPGYAQALNSLGVALAEQGRLPEAILKFQAAVGVDPDDAEARYNWGLVDLSESKTAEAIKELGIAVKLQPDNAQFHYQLGVALSFSNEIRGAIRQIQVALRLNPGNASEHYTLALLLSREGDHAEYASQFMRFAQLQQKMQREKDEVSAQAALEIGNGLRAMKAGDLNEAVDNFTQAVQSAPQSATAHNHLGVALAKEGEKFRTRWRNFKSRSALVRIRLLHIITSQP